MIDLHSHILPGVDDGVRSIEDACALARAAAGDGIRTIAATPHVRDDYPTAPGAMESAVGELRSALRADSIPVEILEGGEVALDYLPRIEPGELRRFTYAQNGRYLLVEFPYYGWPLSLEHELLRLRSDGFSAVLAHPERNAEVQEHPERLERAVRAGALVQVTAASIDGRLGRRARKTARELFDAGLAHVVASDAHAPEVRAVGLSAAAAALRDPGLAALATTERPAAIVAGADVT